MNGSAGAFLRGGGTPEGAGGRDNTVEVDGTLAAVLAA